MKPRTERVFLDAGFAVMRTPLLSFAELAGLGAELSAPGAFDGDLAPCLAADRRAVMQRMFGLFARADVGEAIYLASPSLFESAERARADVTGAAASAVAPGLFRYLARLCARPTPFGLLAGNTVVPLGPASCLELGPRAQHRSYSQLDAGLLDALVTALASRTDCREVLRYKPSSTLFARHASLRYVESQLSNSGLRDNVVTSVERTRALDVALAAATDATRRQIGDALVAALDVPLEEALAYVDQLIDGQLLVPNIALSVTGAPPLAALVAELERVGAPPAVVSPLRETASALAAIDAEPIGRAPARYHPIAAVAATLGGDSEGARRGAAFHVELHKPSPAARLGPAVLRELERGMGALTRVATARSSPALDRFRAAFFRRYGSRSVRLVDALDDETGVGFDPESSLATAPAPLLDGIWGTPPAEAAVAAAPTRDQALLRLYTRALVSGAREIHLDDGDLASLQAPAVPPLPDAFSALVTVLAASAQEADAGRFQLLVRGTFGPSGATSLGRFCHGDPALADHVRVHLRQEEALRPHYVFAEISHRSQPRLGNVVGRPLLRDHEIAYLSRGGAEPAHAIPVDDLWISMSDRIVLWSQRLGREVVPRLAAAHSVGGADLPIYRFLTALQSDGVLGQLAFDWGALGAAPFLPRVVHGRTILYEAAWRLEHVRLKPLATMTPVERYRTVAGLRSQLRLPRWIWAGDGDERLCLDLEQPLAVDALIAMGADGDLVVREALVGDSELCAVDDELRRYCHELLVPFARARTVTPAPGPRPAAANADADAAPTSARRCFPGSDWLSLKIYCGALSIDRVLLQAVEPLASAALAAGRIERWYFLRYADPTWHLRARFQTTVPDQLSPIVAELRQRLGDLIDDEVVSAIEIDTYEREIERHGGLQAQPLIEELFAADSVAVTRLLAALHGDSEGDGAIDVGARRWQACLLGVDTLLGALGLSPEGRRAVCDDITAGLQREMSGGAGPEQTRLDQTMGRLFRNERAVVQAVLGGACEAAPGLGPAAAVFAERSRDMAAPLRGLGELAARGALGVSWHDVALRLVHLHVNRMMDTRQRQHELMLCALLARHHRSTLARARAEGRSGLVPRRAQVEIANPKELP